MSTEKNFDLKKEVNRIKEIENSIILIRKSMEDLESGRLTRKALLVLLAHATKLPHSNIEKVLNALGDLEKLYLKPMEDL